jgi:hypothetical protein
MLEGRGNFLIHVNGSDSLVTYCEGDILTFLSSTGTFGKHEEALAAQIPHYDRHPRQAGREGELPTKKK